MLHDRHTPLNPFVDALDQWDQVLRAYASVIDDHRNMLTTLCGDSITSEQALLPSRFVPPAGLGPLPTELLPRARALAAETAGLVELASSLSAELAAESGGAATGSSGVRPMMSAPSGTTMDQRM